MIERLQRLSTFSALRHHDYRMLWLSSSFTSLSMYTLMVGRGWLTFHLSGSSAWVGLVTFAGMVPFLLAPIGGLLADRLERRRLAAATSAVSGLLALVQTVMIIAGIIEVWHIVVVTLIMGVARAAENPAYQALLPSTVPKDDLLNAVALRSSAFFGARFVGPALAAPLLATTGPSGVFAMSTAFYALATMQVLQMRVASYGGVRSEVSAWRNLEESVSYTLRTPSIALLMIIVTIHCALTMSFDSLLPAFSQDVLNSGGSVFSILTMAMGAGALGGTLLLAGLRDDRMKGQWFMITAVLSGLTPLALAVSGSLPMAVASLVAMGAAQSIFMALSNAFLLSTVPDALRGRVSSLYLMLTGGIMAWANLLNGTLADVWGVPVLLIVPALAYLALTLAISVARPRLRYLYRTGTLATA